MKLGIRHAFVFLFASLFLFCAPAHVAAQTANTAIIVGTVTDPGGAVVPNAQVELINTATNESRKTETNNVGQYTFANVAPGVYRVSTTMQGFRKQIVESLRVEVSKSYNVNFTLQVGQLAQVVEVTAGVGMELQTTDSTVGNVLRGDQLQRMPVNNRSAVALIQLQPMSMPYTFNGDNDNTGGQVAGARSDQSTFSLDGADATDNTVGTHPVKPSNLGVEPIIPVPIESVEEFRVGTTNPNATFGRSSGGQFIFVTKRGTNQLHGLLYWYHQNDALNANRWDLNRVGQPKPPLRDNRFGANAGGPIWKDKTFIFGHYEGRRLPQSATVSRIVPTDTLKAGILQFRDASGVVRQYPLATSAACGSSGTLACDPRGLGLNPVINQLWGFYPEGNDPSQGDGLNTIGFRTTAPLPTRSEFGVLRVDHEFTKNWHLDTSFRYSTHSTLSATQVDIGGVLPGDTKGKATALRQVPVQPRYFVAGLTGQISSHFTNEFRFGYLRDWWWLTAATPFPQVSGTNVALQVAGAAAGNLGGLLDQPVDTHTQLARTQGVNSKNYQFIDNATWFKGKHTFQFGGTIRHILLFHLRNDKVVGSLTALLAEVDKGNAVTIPDQFRPPDCGGSVTTNCLVSGDVTRWNRLYAGVTGMIDNIGVLLVRDGSLNNLPLGTALTMDTTNRAYDFYFNDTWRLRPSLTISAGLTYQWQTPPVEKLSRNTFLVDASTGKILTSRTYLANRRQAAIQGDIYNPTLGFQTLKASGRDRIMDIDWSNVGPRIALAWNPSFSSGLEGKMFGERKMVVRVGYSTVYDRLNTVQTVVIPLLGVGFAQTINCRGPRFNTGTSNPCANTSDPTNAWRIGVDGPAPIPPIPAAATSPVVPSTPFGELLSFQMDPDIKVGRSHSFDFTVQRQLPANMLLEVGFATRLGRRLNQNVQLTSVPYFMVDKNSGQTLAQAFDLVAAQIRNSQPVTPQPWFENVIGPGSTATLASIQAGAFRDGLLSDLWTTMQFLTPQAISNLQVLDLWIRTDGGRSNYKALFVTLHKGTSRGLTFDFNYTLSKAEDQAGLIQNYIGTFSSSYDRDIDYGPSFFDRRHVVNALWTYEFPFGHGRRFAPASAWANKFVGGWSVSGIFTFNTGLPLTVAQSNQVWGGDPLGFSVDSGAIPLGSTDVGGSVHSGVRGSGGVGTTGDPANSGSGFNLFADPLTVFNSFRKIRISEDSHSARGVLRGLSRWNTDLSLGKRTSITESVRTVFTFDFLNAFNHVQLADPTLSLQSPESFGVLTTQFNNPRTIQFGLRLEF